MFGDRHDRRPSPQSRGVAVGGSVLTHALAATLGIWLSTLPRSDAAREAARTAPRYDLIWLAAPGPGGGGGGGGDRTKVAAPARLIGKDRLTVPTVQLDPKPVETPKEPPPIEALTIPATPTAAATEIARGVLEPTPSTETTQGPGSGGGAGTGAGSGSGEGRGSGLGPGFGGGTGGEVYRPGSGVSMPRLVREVKPGYTANAMRAKVQGMVVVECVVLPDGTVGDIRVIKSLDKAFGLDEEAVKATKLWRFVPGLRFGEPVPVFVTIELSFTLR